MLLSARPQLSLLRRKLATQECHSPLLCGLQPYVDSWEAAPDTAVLLVLHHQQGDRLHASKRSPQRRLLCCKLAV